MKVDDLHIEAPPGSIRIFVGSDDRSEPTERVLQYTIRIHTKHEVDITWMRAGDPGWGWTEWYRGKEASQWTPKSGGGWGTAFSAFRFAIPELCDFEGKALYMDSDQLVLGDVAELWKRDTGPGWESVNLKRTCVSVIDCAKMRGVFPPIAEMKRTGMNTRWYLTELMRQEKLSPTLPPLWNCFDNVPSGCKLLHWTNMRLQPWKPWPEHVRYSLHPSEKAMELWRRYERESRAA